MKKYSWDHHKETQKDFAKNGFSSIEARPASYQNTTFGHHINNSGPAPESGLFSFVFSRLRGREDSEHEMTLNRIALIAIVFFYLWLDILFQDQDTLFALRRGFPLLGAYSLLSLGIFVHLLWQPRPTPARRIISIFIDIGAISYGLFVGGSASAFLYPFYLWTIFGNGLRFGQVYLAIATIVSTLGFASVVLFAGFWQSHLTLTGGLLAGLIVLPTYAAILIKRLSEAKRIAEQASQTKSIFLASVSHELRTPLNAIIGLSDLLKDSVRDEEMAGMVHTIGTSGRNLLDLINAILDSSRFDVGKIMARPEEADLYALLSNVRDMLLVEANAKGIRLALHLAPEVPRHVIISVPHIQDALVNLVSNAVKFTQHGHVLIKTCVLGQDSHGVRLRFEVIDTGIGISESAQSGIFDSFVQADTTIMDRFGGSGLGLYIARQLIESQNGTISVKSRLGEGSQFIIEIDAKVAARQDTVQETGSISVLVLSEDAAFLQMMSMTGARISQVSTQAALLVALAQSRRQGVYRPIAILDQKKLQNDINGVAKAILDEAALRHCKLIALLCPKNGNIATDSPLQPDTELFITFLDRPFDRQSVERALLMAQGTALPRTSENGHAPLAERMKRPLSVLVAEDNATNQKVIVKILERSGHHITLASDGEIALDLLGTHHFDLVLMDVNMPVMNGIETVKLYRFSSMGSPHVPIIGLTADATPECRERCLEAGMDECVAKPIEARRLVELVERIAGEHLHGDRPLPPSPRAQATKTETLPSVDTQSLEPGTLRDLKNLGGQAFLDDVIKQFTADAADIIAKIEKSVEECDLFAFRDKIHSLRSCAGNVGAQGIFQLCLEWRMIERDELVLHGHDYLRRLRSEFGRTVTGLDQYLSKTDAAKASGKHESIKKSGKNGPLRKAS